MRFINIINIGFFVLLFTACQGGTKPRLSTNTQSIHSVPSTLQSEYLSAINKARTQNQTCGSRGFFAAGTALVWNNKLYSAAYEHSNDMAVSNTFSHSGSGTVSDLTGQREGGKSQVVERIESYGYQWSRYGENIAGGTTSDTGEKAVAQLMKSDYHCAAIMNPDYTEVGMAMVKNSSSRLTHYWTQDFGRP